MESAAPWASSAPRMSESVVAAGAPRVLISPASRARAASSVALTRLPLCPSATPVPAAVLRNTGWAFSQVVEPRGGVAAVADGDVALHRAQRLLVEDLADQPEVLEHQHLGAVGDGDARGFLAAVLQRVQAVVGELGDLFARRPDAEYAALFSWFVLGLLGRSR